MTPSIYLGCAGWSVASGHPDFGALAQGKPGSVLERYAARLGATEINSSFYRLHRRSTYAKWAASTPAGFRFSVKVPKSITHAARLQGCGPALAEFLDGAQGLGDKLGCLLVQLPPSLAFDAAVAEGFFGELRAQTDVAAACEPRHASWFTAGADALLGHYSVGRVAADPARVPEAAVPGGESGTVYYRWHGSPRMYYSAYARADLERLAAALQSQRGDAWVIFDNTAAGAGAANALELGHILAGTS